MVKRSPNYLQSQLDRSGNTSYPQLVVKASVQGNGQAGLGLFATSVLPAGSALPLVGKLIYQVEEDMLLYSGRGSYLVHTPRGTINGDPTHLPYRNVGYRGKAIWALVNEPTRAKPNCIFRQDYLMVVESIDAGVELTVSYGNGEDYHRTYPVSRYCFGRQYYRFLDGRQ